MSSISALEADIAARRERLANTIDELTRRASPQAIVDRQKAAAKAKFVGATQTPEGELRVDRVATIVAVVAVALVVAIWRRRRG